MRDLTCLDMGLSDHLEGIEHKSVVQKADILELEYLRV